MFSEKSKNLALLLLFLIFGHVGFSQNTILEEKDQKALELSLDLLKRYFAEEDLWYPFSPETGESVRGLVHFIEKEPIDTIIMNLNETLEDSTFRYVYRLPENVPDSLDIPGYYPAQKLQDRLDILWASLKAEYKEKELTVPMEMLSDIDDKAEVVAADDYEELFDGDPYVIPDSLQTPEVIPDSLMQSPEDFSRFLLRDSLRKLYIAEKLESYNDSLLWAYRDSVVQDYRQQQLEQEYTARTIRLTDSVQLNNYEVLKSYNDSIVEAVNDSISLVLGKLLVYADFIDTTRLKMINLTGDESSILLQNGPQYFSRVWLKNEQKDSLKVMVKNQDKKTIQLLIDDGVTISRFKPKETKDFDFSSLTERFPGFTGVEEKYQVLTPWRIGGNGSVGFNQTYLENWKKGGQSALSLLLVLKGFANYSSAKGKLKWENSCEIRNGWIRPGGKETETQKNDDKFEITSRVGVSAFKKWYYSAEFNYETQLLNGYNYPKSSHPDPMSAFMGPATTFFKIGLDYKPSNNFSLFLSPLTAKNVYVKDTMKIDQTNFGIETGEKGFWRPGLNLDLNYKKAFTPDITYQTKYKMFVNYKAPFSKFDINWENLVDIRLNDHINLQAMVHLKYDDNIMFPVYNDSGEKIGEKAKLQIREFLSIGFSYQINRQVTRTRRKN